MDTPKTSTIVDHDLAKLRALYEQVQAHRVAGSDFVDLVNAMDWQTKPPEVFSQAIDMALGLDAVKIARKLATLGHELYPEDDYLKRAAYVLAPGQSVATTRPPRKEFAESMAWLRAHREAYRGLWLAIQEGQLLKSASSYETLMEALGDRATTLDVIITHIP